MNLRKILPFLLILVLLLPGCSAKKNETPAPAQSLPPIETPPPSATPAPTPSAAPTPTPKPVSSGVQALEEENRKVWDEMHEREWMEGRFVVPSAGIDVALFSWGDEPDGDYDDDKRTEIVRQAVVDNEDSALLYRDEPVGNIIAEHSNQEFSKLSSVKEGDPAYILAGERVVSLACSLVTTGTNTGRGIIDSQGGWHYDGLDYVCYTCIEDWTHILIVGFKMTDEDYYDVAWKEGRAVEGEKGEAPVVDTAALAQTVPSPTPTPTPMPAPTPTPAPTAKPVQNNPAPAQNNPAPAQDDPQIIHEDPIPGGDIYAYADLPYGYIDNDLGFLG